MKKSEPAAMDAHAAIQFASKQLRECLANHESCSKRARLATIWSSDNMHIVRDLGVGDKMPRRLLKVQGIQLDQGHDVGPALKLVDLKGTAEEFPYIALSYCWGDAVYAAETLKTTESNVEEFMDDGIKWDLLPKTFRDAVQIARGLRIPYLWIDALCIVQGDAEDWKTEAPRMAVVYGNATATLHAVDAANSDGGLFLDERSITVPDTLETRAWTMQEHAISPRSLLFSKQKVSWECREAKAILPAYGDDNGELTLAALAVNDAGSEPQAESISLKEIFVFFRDWRLPDSGPDPEPNPDGVMDLDYGISGDEEDYLSFLRTWWSLVSLYSVRRLSYESDKLLALNGIAAVAQRWVRVRNTWGLWMDFLQWELLWYVDRDSPARSQRTSRWLAPSWSWASVKEGRVRNACYERATVGLKKGAMLMIKPEIRIPVGTSFDQTLPIPAWKTKMEFYSIMLKGDLRRGEITVSLDDAGKKRYDVSLDPVGRWSENETCVFKPDFDDDFPVGGRCEIICLLFYHYYSQPEDGQDDEAEAKGDMVNLSLVLQQTRGPQALTTNLEDVSEADLQAERTMSRLGILETSFSVMREWLEIHKDYWHKAVWLV
jgi:hypothetical protein